MSIKLPKIFLDSSDPAETKKAKGLIGFLDGQTTNPSLVAKNPEVIKHVESGKKLTKDELLNFYKKIIAEIDKEIAGALSVEVYAEMETPAQEMLTQAEQMFTWGRNIYIKFPTTPEGVKAAHEFVKNGGRVNMTLVFDQVQAGAVYSATLQTKSPAFLSPFIGRWDDRGYDGMDLIKNILKQYRKYDKAFHRNKPHVELLAASIRNLEHFYASIFMGANIVTVPLKILYDWMQDEKWIPDEHYRIPPRGLKPIVYQNIPYHPEFEKYQIDTTGGTLLDEGLKKFVNDWNKVLTEK